MSPRRIYRAVIFDMDGVLADSEPVFLEALNAVLEPYGKRLDEQQHAAIMGTSPEDSWRAVAEMVGLDKGALDQIIAAYDAKLQELLPGSRLLPGVVETIDGLRQRGVPYAVASSSRPAWIDALLGGIGIRDRFEVAVSGDEVARPKPAPDIYLRAAERLGVPPSDCIALEDTPTGIASAKAAGMFTVQVRSSSTAFPPQDEADMVLDSLEDFDFDLLD